MGARRASTCSALLPPLLTLVASARIVLGLPLSQFSACLASVAWYILAWLPAVSYILHQGWPRGHAKTRSKKVLSQDLKLLYPIVISKALNLS